MQFSTFSFLAAVFAAHPIDVLAGEISSGPSGSPTCVTITETSGSTCPTLTGFCVRPACLELKTITLECGCASIFSTTSCETTCGHGCGTSYDTVHIPCATSVSSPPPVTTTTSASTSSCSTSSSTSILTPTPTSLPMTSTIYPNSTITGTSTTIITISSCPASVTCTGQTTTWTGTSGPSTCPTSTSCSCVLPGGGSTQTVTEVTVTTPGKTGPTPTASSSGSPSPVQANEGANVRRFGLVEGGVLVGLIGAVVGML